MKNYIKNKGILYIQVINLIYRSKKTFNCSEGKENTSILKTGEKKEEEGGGDQIVNLIITLVEI